MNNKYIVSKDLAMIFATLFLGTSLFQNLFHNNIIVIIWLLLTLIPTLISISLMVLFRNEQNN